MKRNQSTILHRAALTLLMAFMTAAAWAAVGDELTDNNLKYKVTSESTKTVELTGYVNEPTGALNIPATVNGYSVTTIGEDVFINCIDLTSITIPASVMTIGRYAFLYCIYMTSVTFEANSQLTTIDQSAFEKSGLTSVTIPASVTAIGQGAFSGSGLTSVTFEANSQLTTIGQSAFSGCSGLTSITIPASVTTIDQSAFYACSGLTSFTFEANSQLTTIGESAFYYCSGLTSITIPASMTTIGQGAFSGSSLTSITIPASVTAIGKGAFYNCSGLTSVTFEANSQLTTIGESAFYYCSGLTSMTIPASVTAIEKSAFSGCTSLTSVTFAENSQLTTIGDGAFYGSGLTSITIPASVTSIGESAFYGCSGLTSVTFEDISQLPTVGDNAFTGCSALTVTLSVTDLAAFCNNTIVNQIRQKIGIPVKLVDGDGTEITSYVIPSGVTSLGYYAFYNCTGLTSITIPASVTSLGNYAFAECTGLASITIPISVGDNFTETTFKNCPLTTIKVPVTDATAFCNNKLVGKIAYYFGKPVVLVDGDGTEITSFTIPNDVTSIGNSAFWNCTGLAEVIAHDNVTSVNSTAFFNTAWYNNLPDGLTYIGKVAYIFKGNDTSVTIKDGTTSICSSAFSYSKLTSVIIPEGVTSIGDHAFQYSSSLASVSLPDGLTTIGDHAFWCCYALTSIAIPASVTAIKEYALDDCPSVTLYATTPPSAYNAFNNSPGFRLYVFSDLVDTYKDMSYNINNRSKKIVAIPDLTVNDAGGELGKWCTYYNGLADVTVPEGTTIYTAALNSTKSGVILTEVDGNIIKKGEAVLLKSADNITLTSAASSGTGDYTGNVLQGVDVSTPQASGVTYYVLSKPEGKDFGFYKLADGTNLAANKAYLVIPASARAFFGFDGETTAMEEVRWKMDDVRSKMEEGRGDWYTLDGRKLQGEPSQKGVYVRNGQKFIIK